MSRITQVFYGNDCLPYKDSERTVHYPITGSSFAGSSNVNELHFYVRDIGGVNNLSWVAIVKLPNGKILYQLLTDIHLDSEINEYYVTFNLSQFYTQLKGDIYISLNGCMGQVEISTDEETDISTIQGEIDSRTVVVTGAVKFSINYAPQRPIGFSFDLDQYQTIINALANKANIVSTIQVVADITTEDLSAYDNGQKFFSLADNTYYEKISTSPYYQLVENNSGVLASERLLIKSNIPVIGALKDIAGEKGLVIYSYNNKDYLVSFDASDLTNIKGCAFDLFDRCFYYAENLVVGNNIGLLINSNNKIEHLDKKDDTLTVYGVTAQGTQVMIPYDLNANVFTLVMRDAYGQVHVPLVPTSNGNATSKKYVDDLISSIKANAFIMVDTTTYPTLNSFLASTGEEGYIYLYPISISDLTKGYYQYIWEGSSWLDIGTTQIDLSGYVPTTRTITGLSLENDITKEELQIALGITDRDVYKDATFYQGGLQTNYDYGLLGVKIADETNNNRVRTVNSEQDLLANTLRFRNGEKVEFKIVSGYKYSYAFYKKVATPYNPFQIAAPLSFDTENKVVTVSDDYNYLVLMVGKIDDNYITLTEAKNAIFVGSTGIDTRINELEEQAENINEEIENINEGLQKEYKKTILNGKLLLPDTYELPFDVIKTEKGYYPNVSIEQLNNSPLKVYINVSSTDTGLGTSEANPITLYQFKQNIINDLYSSQNIELIFIDKVNLFSAQSSFDLIGTGNANVKNITIAAKYDNTWIGVGLQPTWEATATEDIYKFTSSDKISDLCDLENVNALGLPDIYHKVSDIASVIAEKGTFYQNESNVVYINPRANNDLTKIVALYGNAWTNTSKGIICIRKITEGNVIFKNIGFLMDTLSIRDCRTMDNSFWFFNCKFHRGSQDAFGIDGLYNAYLIDCVADYASKDNFNYHGTNKDIIAAEFNCISYGAGKYKLDTNGANTTTNSNNGSTAHNGMTIMRFGCSYWECEGAIIADVNNCKTLNVDCVAKNVLPTISNPNYNAIFMFHDNRNAQIIYRDDTHTNYLINCGGIGASYKCDIEGMIVVVSNFATNIENNYISGGTYTEENVYM